MPVVMARNTREAGGPPSPPVRADGSLFPLCMAYSGETRLVYADSGAELLDVLSPGYAAASPVERVAARRRIAVDVQVRLQAVLLAGALPGETTANELVVLSGPRHLPVRARTWDSVVPLVLVTTHYEPFTSISRPVSGIADVQSPPNLVWLADEDDAALLMSLDESGWVRLLVPVG